MGLNTSTIFGSAMAQAASCWPLILDTPAHFQASPCRICAAQLIILVINIVNKQNVLPLLQFRRKMKKRVLACNWHFASDRRWSLIGRNCTFCFWQFSYCSGYLPYSELQDVGSEIWYFHVTTVVRRLTARIRPEKCVVRRFLRCANVIECARTYTNLDSIAYYTPRLHGITSCS